MLTYDLPTLEDQINIEDEDELHKIVIELGLNKVNTKNGNSAAFQ